MPGTLESWVCDACDGKPQLELVSERKLNLLFAKLPDDVDIIRTYRCPVCKTLSVVTGTMTDGRFKQPSGAS